VWVRLLRLDRLQAGGTLNGDEPNLLTELQTKIAE